MIKKHFSFLIIIMLVLVLLPMGCAKQAETPVSTNAGGTSATPTVKESVTITSPTPGGATPEATPTIQTIQPEAGVIRRDPFMAPIEPKVKEGSIPGAQPGPGPKPRTGPAPELAPVYTLTGVFSYNKRTYAILSDAVTNYIVKQGQKVGGFTLTRVNIKKKEVVLTSAKGTNFIIKLQEPGQSSAGTPGAYPGAMPPGAVPPQITPPGGEVPPSAPPSGESTSPGGGIPPGAPPQ